MQSVLDANILTHLRLELEWRVDSRVCLCNERFQIICCCVFILGSALMITLLTEQCYSSSLLNLSLLCNVLRASFFMGVHGIFTEEFLVAVGTGKRAKQNIVRGFMRIKKASV